MKNVGQLMLEDPRRVRMVSFLIAFALHASTLAIGGVMLVKPAQFAVESGVNGIEVHLTAAPQEPVAEMPKEEIKIPDSAPEDSIPLPVEVPVQKSGALEKIQEEKGSSNTGKDKISLSSVAGAVTEVRPDYLKNPAPVYPIDARRSMQEGLVILSVDVDRQGNPVEVKVEKSSGYSLLDDSAVTTVRGWKFFPACIGELAIGSHVEVPVRFQIKKCRGCRCKI